MVNLDDALQFTSAGMSFAVGSSALFSPVTHEKLWWNDASGRNKFTTTYAGLGCFASGSNSLLMGLDKKADKKDKRNAMKIAGATWIVASAIGAHEAMSGKARTAVAYPSAGVFGALGAAMLYRGFKE